MSTIKWKFNIGTAAMFLWCLALATIITQPILARANNEWGNITVDTTFSETKTMSLDTISVENSMNVWNSRLSNWQFCNSEGTCLSLEWDMLSVNKIKIWSWSTGNTDVLLISWNLLYYKQENYPYNDTFFKLNAIDDFLSKTALKQELYGSYWLIDAYGDPLRSRIWWITSKSFKDSENDSYNCSDSSNEWTIHYKTKDNWSQLIMCMKISESEYSGVVLKEF